jgi:hypothetical protein
MYVKYGILQFENVVIPILSNNSHLQLINIVCFQVGIAETYNTGMTETYNTGMTETYNTQVCIGWGGNVAIFLDEINNRFKYNRFIIIVPNGFNKICQLNINDYCV